MDTTSLSRVTGRTSNHHRNVASQRRPSLPSPGSLGFSALIACWLITGCADAEQADSTLVRDSAGVAIVTSTTPAWDASEPWQLSEEPRLTIGVLAGNPAYEFSDIRGVSRLTDGRIAVADNGAHELRVFDLTGAHVASAGRLGGGPGEFRRLTWMGVLEGDTIVVYDQPQRRVSVFDAAARHVRDVSIARNDRTFFPILLGRDSAGNYIGQLYVRRRAEELPDGLVQDSVAIIRLDPTGRLLDTLTMAPHFLRDVRMRSVGDRRLRIPATLPFSPEAVSVYANGRTYLGTGETFEIRTYGAAGHLERLTRLEGSPPEITAADIDGLVAHWRGIYEGQTENPEVKFFLRRLEETTPPERFPAFSAIVVDPAGHLWVTAYRRPWEDVPPRWTIIDSQGRWLGELEGPAGFQLMEAGSDYLLGIEPDEMEVQRVVLYDLIKP